MKLKLTLALIVVAAVIIGLVARSHSQAAKRQPVETTVSGVVKFVAASAETITITTTDSVETTLALDSTSKVYDESGNAISLTDIKPGMSVQAEGTSTQTSVISSRITIVSRPPEATDISNPCPGVLTEENNSISCRIAVTSRITISLPSNSYPKSSLSINPSGAFGETFGASTQNDRWIRTFQANQPGKVTISVPSNDKAKSSFKATFDIYGEAPTTTDAAAASTDTATGTSQ